MLELPACRGAVHTTLPPLPLLTAASPPEPAAPIYEELAAEFSAKGLKFYKIGAEGVARGRRRCSQTAAALLHQLTCAVLCRLPMRRH